MVNEEKLNKFIKWYFIGCIGIALIATTVYGSMALADRGCDVGIGKVSSWSMNDFLFSMEHNTSNEKNVIVNIDGNTYIYRANATETIAELQEKYRTSVDYIITVCGEDLKRISRNDWINRNIYYRFKGKI